MKTMLSILLLSGFSLLQVTGQDIVDDVYFKPGDVQKTQNQRVTPRPSSNIKPNYKNGAKEIVYLDSRQSKDIILSGDSIFILAEINDSILNDTLLYQQTDEEGYYLNGFKGTNTEYEYAERIRRFHNPKYTIHISDPQYTDIYFLDNYNWNVYVDGSYAWVTPTWTNPAWWNYYWTPYSYNSWYWRSSWYSPWSYYNNWYGYQGYGMGYGWNSFYGGYYPYYGGYWGGGMYGYGYPYHHNSWYNSWYYPYSGGYYGNSSRKQNYSENVRREYSGFANSASNNTRISGGSQAVSGSSRTAAVYSANGDRNINNNSRTVYSSARSEGQFETGRTVTTLRNTRTPDAGISETGIRTRTTNTIRSSEGSNNDERVYNPTGQRNQNNVQINRSSVTGTTSTPTVRNQEVNTSRTTTGTVVRSGTGTSPVRSSTVTSSGSSEQSRNSSSSSTRSTYTAPSNSSSSSSSSSTSTYSSGSTVRSSTPSYSAPSSSGSSSGGGGSRSSGGGSSSGGRR